MKEHIEAELKKEGGARRTKTQLGAMIISVFAHVLLLILVGSYVIIQGVLPRKMFTSADIVNDDQAESAPDPELEQKQEPLDTPSEPSEEIAVPASQSESLSIDVLTSPISQSNLYPLSSVGAITSPSVLVSTESGKSQGDTQGSGQVKGKIVHSIFGNSEAVPAALSGTLYDLKQKKSGGSVDEAEFLRGFAKAGFSRDLLDSFYSTDVKLYATQFLLPLVPADLAPKSFQAEDKVKPTNWIAVYEGEFAAPKRGSYRFVGKGDDVLIVRVDGKVVLDASINAGMGGEPLVGWAPKPEQIGKGQGPKPYFPLIYGDWIDLERNVNHSVQVILGEMPGGEFYSYLFIEQEGEKYERDPKFGNAPILPIFRTLNTKEDWSGVSPEFLPSHLKNGPVFTPTPNR